MRVEGIFLWMVLFCLPQKDYGLEKTGKNKKYHGKQHGKSSTQSTSTVPKAHHHSHHHHHHHKGKKSTIYHNNTFIHQLTKDKILPKITSRHYKKDKIENKHGKRKSKSSTISKRVLRYHKRQGKHEHRKRSNRHTKRRGSTNPLSSFTNRNRTSLINNANHHKHGHLHPTSNVFSQLKSPLHKVTSTYVMSSEQLQKRVHIAEGGKSNSPEQDHTLNDTHIRSSTSNYSSLKAMPPSDVNAGKRSDYILPSTPETEDLVIDSTAASQTTMGNVGDIETQRDGTERIVLQAPDTESLAAGAKTIIEEGRKDTDSRDDAQARNAVDVMLSDGYLQSAALNEQTSQPLLLSNVKQLISGSLSNIKQYVSNPLEENNHNIVKIDAMLQPQESTNILDDELLQQNKGSIEKILRLLNTSTETGKLCKRTVRSAFTDCRQKRDGVCRAEGLDEFRDKALQLHNNLRKIHHSPPLELNDFLNNEAEKYALEMARISSVKHSNRKNRPGQGENIAVSCTSAGSELRAEETVNEWYGKVCRRSFNFTDYVNGIEPFAQMVWKATNFLGIGKATSKRDGVLCTYVVGRYSPEADKTYLTDNVLKGDFAEEKYCTEDCESGYSEAEDRPGKSPLETGQPSLFNEDERKTIIGNSATGVIGRNDRNLHMAIKKAKTDNSVASKQESKLSQTNNPVKFKRSSIFDLNKPRNVSKITKMGNRKHEPITRSHSFRSNASVSSINSTNRTVRSSIKAIFDVHNFEKVEKSPHLSGYPLQEFSAESSKSVKCDNGKNCSKGRKTSVPKNPKTKMKVLDFYNEELGKSFHVLANSSLENISTAEVANSTEEALDEIKNQSVSKGSISLASVRHFLSTDPNLLRQTAESVLKIDRKNASVTKCHTPNCRQFIATGTNGRPEETPIPITPVLIPVGILKAFRDDMIRLHNELRKIHVAPPLIINQDLNLGAQAYATDMSQRGVIEHSKEDSRPSIGESVAEVCSEDESLPTAEEVIKKWYLEVCIPGFDFTRDRIPDGTQEFTQMIWRGTKELGIGLSAAKAYNGTLCTYIVARYKKAGNQPDFLEDNVMKGEFLESRCHVPSLSQSTRSTNSAVSNSPERPFAKDAISQYVLEPGTTDLDFKEPLEIGTFAHGVDDPGTIALGLQSLANEGGEVWNKKKEKQIRNVTSSRRAVKSHKDYQVPLYYMHQKLQSDPMNQNKRSLRKRRALDSSEDLNVTNMSITKKDTNQYQRKIKSTGRSIKIKELHNLTNSVTNSTTTSSKQSKHVTKKSFVAPIYQTAVSVNKAEVRRHGRPVVATKQTIPQIEGGEEKLPTNHVTGRTPLRPKALLYKTIPNDSPEISNSDSRQSFPTYASTAKGTQSSRKPLKIAAVKRQSDIVVATSKKSLLHARKDNKKDSSDGDLHTPLEQETFAPDKDEGEDLIQERKEMVLIPQRKTKALKQTAIKKTMKPDTSYIRKPLQSLGHQSAPSSKFNRSNVRKSLSSKYKFDVGFIRGQKKAYLVIARSPQQSHKNKIPSTYSTKSPKLADTESDVKQAKINSFILPYVKTNKISKSSYNTMNNLHPEHSVNVSGEKRVLADTRSQLDSKQFDGSKEDRKDDEKNVNDAHLAENQGIKVDENYKNHSYFVMDSNNNMKLVSTPASPENELSSLATDKTHTVQQGFESAVSTDGLETTKSPEIVDADKLSPARAKASEKLPHKQDSSNEFLKAREISVTGFSNSKDDSEFDDAVRGQESTSAADSSAKEADISYASEGVNRFSQRGNLYSTDNVQSINKMNTTAYAREVKDRGNDIKHTTDATNESDVRGGRDQSLTQDATGSGVEDQHEGLQKSADVVSIPKVSQVPLNGASLDEEEAAEYHLKSRNLTNEPVDDPKQFVMDKEGHLILSRIRNPESTYSSRAQNMPTTSAGDNYQTGSHEDQASSHLAAETYPENKAMMSSNSSEKYNVEDSLADTKTSISGETSNLNKGSDGDTNLQLPKDLSNEGMLSKKDIAKEGVSKSEKEGPNTPSKQDVQEKSSKILTFDHNFTTPKSSLFHRGETAIPEYDGFTGGTNKEVEEENQTLNMRTNSVSRANQEAPTVERNDANSELTTSSPAAPEHNNTNAGIKVEQPPFESVEAVPGPQVVAPATENNEQSEYSSGKQNHHKENKAESSKDNSQAESNDHTTTENGPNDVPVQQYVDQPSQTSPTLGTQESSTEPTETPLVAQPTSGSSTSNNIDNSTEVDNAKQSSEQTFSIDIPPKRRPEDTTEFIQDALITHNKLRLIHDAPPLQLDQDLCNEADEYAHQIITQKKGILEHSERDLRKGEGENLAMSCKSSRDGLTGAEATFKWYSDICEKGYDFNSKEIQTGTGHFTQLVWKSSKRFGIGRTSMKKNGRFCTVVVARYAPQGNVRGEFSSNVEPGAFTDKTCDKVERAFASIPWHLLAPSEPEKPLLMEDNREDEEEISEEDQNRFPLPPENPAVNSGPKLGANYNDTTANDSTSSGQTHSTLENTIHQTPTESHSYPTIVSSNDFKDLQADQPQSPISNEKVEGPSKDSTWEKEQEDKNIEEEYSNNKEQAFLRRNSSTQIMEQEAEWQNDNKNMSVPKIVKSEEGNIHHEDMESQYGNPMGHTIVNAPQQQQQQVTHASHNSAAEGKDVNNDGYNSDHDSLPKVESTSLIRVAGVNGKGETDVKEINANEQIQLEDEKRREEQLEKERQQQQKEKELKEKEEAIEKERIRNEEKLKEEKKKQEEERKKLEKEREEMDRFREEERLKSIEEYEMHKKKEKEEELEREKERQKEKEANKIQPTEKLKPDKEKEEQPKPQPQQYFQNTQYAASTEHQQGDGKVDDNTKTDNQQKNKNNSNNKQKQNGSESSSQPQQNGAGSSQTGSSSASTGSSSPGILGTPSLLGLASYGSPVIIHIGATGKFEDIETFIRVGLEMHNKFRSIHKSPPLEVDPTLVELAYQYAVQLSYTGYLKHQTYENLAGQGENLAMGCYDNDFEMSAEEAVTVWYSEVCQPGYDFNSQVSNSGTGHFTEVIWGSSTKFGMAKVARMQNGLKCTYVVARYLPGGNVNDQFNTNVKKGNFEEKKVCSDVTGSLLSFQQRNEKAIEMQEKERQEFRISMLQWFKQAEKELENNLLASRNQTEVNQSPTIIPPNSGVIAKSSEKILGPEEQSRPKVISATSVPHEVHKLRSSPQFTSHKLPHTRIIESDNNVNPVKHLSTTIVEQDSHGWHFKQKNGITSTRLRARKPSESGQHHLPVSAISAIRKPITIIKQPTERIIKELDSSPTHHGIHKIIQEIQPTPSGEKPLLRLRPNMEGKVAMALLQNAKDQDSKETHGRELSKFPEEENTDNPPRRSPIQRRLTPDSEAFRISTLNAHNAYRRIHGSSPLHLDLDMSLEAEDYAKTIAKLGKLEHSNTDDGENIASVCRTGNNTMTGQEATTIWYREVCHPGYNFATGLPGNAGHFTQEMWKSTRALGVGRASLVRDGLLCTYIVARYRPAGNYLGEFIANVPVGHFSGKLCNNLARKDLLYPSPSLRGGVESPVTSPARVRKSFVHSNKIPHRPLVTANSAVHPSWSKHSMPSTLTGHTKFPVYKKTPISSKRNVKPLVTPVNTASDDDWSISKRASIPSSSTWGKVSFTKNRLPYVSQINRSPSGNIYNVSYNANGGPVILKNLYEKKLDKSTSSASKKRTNVQKSRTLAIKRTLRKGQVLTNYLNSSITYEHKGKEGAVSGDKRDGYPEYVVSHRLMKLTSGKAKILRAVGRSNRTALVYHDLHEEEKKPLRHIVPKHAYEIQKQTNVKLSQPVHDEVEKIFIVESKKVGMPPKLLTNELVQKTRNRSTENNVESPLSSVLKHLSSFSRNSSRSEKHQPLPTKMPILQYHHLQPNQILHTQSYSLTPNRIPNISSPLQQSLSRAKNVLQAKAKSPSIQPERVHLFSKKVPFVQAFNVLPDDTDNGGLSKRDDNKHLLVHNPVTSLANAANLPPDILLGPSGSFTPTNRILLASKKGAEIIKNLKEKQEYGKVVPWMNEIQKAAAEHMAGRGVSSFNQFAYQKSPSLFPPQANGPGVITDRIKNNLQRVISNARESMIRDQSSTPDSSNKIAAGNTKRPMNTQADNRKQISTLKSNPTGTTMSYTGKDKSGNEVTRMGLPTASPALLKQIAGGSLLGGGKGVFDSGLFGSHFRTPLPVGGKPGPLALATALKHLGMIRKKPILANGGEGVFIAPKYSYHYNDGYINHEEPLYPAATLQQQQYPQMVRPTEVDVGPGVAATAGGINMPLVQGGDYPINGLTGQKVPGMGATTEFQQSALNAHNKYRAIHSADPLVINKELCVEAESWAAVLAARGTLVHSTTSDGENLAVNCKPTSRFTEMTGPEATDLWYKEVCEPGYVFNLGHIAGAGDFTQVVWRDTTDMCIGRAVGKNGDSMCTYVVARYRPAGNLLGAVRENVVKGQLRKEDYCNIFGPSALGKPWGVPGIAIGLPLHGAYNMAPLQPPGGDDPGLGAASENTKEFRLGALNAHNQFRALHGSLPLALNAAMCVEAEEYATVLAKKGSLVRNTMTRDGESIAMACNNKDLEMTGDEATSKWYNEICNPGYDFKGNQPFGAAHFTQIVWKDTKLFGIGKATVKRNGLFCTYVVARYRPAGNVVNLFRDEIDIGNFDYSYCDTLGKGGGGKGMSAGVPSGKGIEQDEQWAASSLYNRAGVMEVGVKKDKLGNAPLANASKLTQPDSYSKTTNVSKNTILKNSTSNVTETSSLQAKGFRKPFLREKLSSHHTLKLKLWQKQLINSHKAKSSRGSDGKVTKHMLKHRKKVAKKVQASVRKRKLKSQRKTLKHRNKKFKRHPKHSKGKRTTFNSYRRHRKRHLRNKNRISLRRRSRKSKKKPRHRCGRHHRRGQRRQHVPLR